VNGILKFVKIFFRNLKFCFFVKGEEDLNYGLLAVASLRSKAVPYPLFKSPKPIARSRGVQSCWRTACGLKTLVNFNKYLKEMAQI